MDRTKRFGNLAIWITAAALILSIIIGSIGARAADGVQMSGDSTYMCADNLALHADISGDGQGDQKLVDGKNTSIYRTDAAQGNYVTVDLGKETAFNTVILKEQGLNVQTFALSVSSDGAQYTPVLTGDKIEYHRLCVVGDITARYLRLTIEASDGPVRLKELEIYKESPRGKNEFMVTGYLSGSWLEQAADFSVSERERRQWILDDMANYRFDGITHLFFYCGCGFAPDGTLYFGSAEKAQAEQERGVALVMECLRIMAPEAKISMVIGMNNPALVNSAMGENRDAFISNLIEKLNRFGFDGLDIDYEFPQSDEDFRIFDEFLVEVKKQMITQTNAGERAILSCAFGTRDIHCSQQAIDAIDIVNCMAYDIMDQDGQHSSFWGCAVQPAIYLESVGFSREQINLGIPFYGTQTQALMEQYNYNEVKGYGYFQNSYIMRGYEDRADTEVYFNAPGMVRDKTAYAFLSGYGGIMVWHFTADVPYDHPYSLWRAVFDAMDLYGKGE